MSLDGIHKQVKYLFWSSFILLVGSYFTLSYAHQVALMANVEMITVNQLQKEVLQKHDEVTKLIDENSNVISNIMPACFKGRQ